MPGVRPDAGAEVQLAPTAARQWRGAGGLRQGPKHLRRSAVHDAARDGRNTLMRRWRPRHPERASAARGQDPWDRRPLRAPPPVQGSCGDSLDRRKSPPGTVAPGSTSAVTLGLHCSSARRGGSEGKRAAFRHRISLWRGSRTSHAGANVHACTGRAWPRRGPSLVACAAFLAGLAGRPSGVRPCGRDQPETVVLLESEVE